MKHLLIENVMSVSVTWIQWTRLAVQKVWMAGVNSNPVSRLVMLRKTPKNLGRN